MTRISHIYLGLLLAVVLTGCTDHDDATGSNVNTEARELQGVQPVIVGAATGTRAGTVTPLVDYVGRNKFVENDRVVFTEIRRTREPFEAFTYPGNDNYDGIIFVAGAEGGWRRAADDGGPERVYWTDAANDHTFIAYNMPQTGFEWNPYTFTQQGTKKTYYVGSLSDPTAEGMIDYSLTPEEQATYTTTVGSVSTYTNPKLEREDLLIAHDTHMHAETGGGVALVKFYHALSSIRVVVNISGFSSTEADHAAVVSNMRVLHQPTMYIWMQSEFGAQPLRVSRQGATITDQEIVNAAWDNGGSNIPAFDQRKDLKLWIPRPAGAGNNQSKTFTFYGITTPQPQDYIINLDENDVNRNLELVFDVTYPNALKPSETITRQYKASLHDVYFEAGYNTTVNVSLNHKNEQMTVGAEYENWEYVATPDEGQLYKNATFLQATDRENVTISSDPAATMDDATWLYEMDGEIYDIYGHTGSAASPYQISTADQLLSFAYEVKNGNDFTGKYVRLDADITLQPTSDKTKQEMVRIADGSPLENYGTYDDAPEAIDWIGIGDENTAFNGTFLGGQRFINRLKGSPLFYSLGSGAKIEQLQVHAVHKPDASEVAVTGGGVMANSNAGMICASRVVGDVVLGDATAGAFVGTNTGKIWCSYHQGLVKGAAASALVGGLAGSNSGVIAACYQAGNVTGATTGGIVAASTGTLDNNFFDSTLLAEPVFVPATGVTGVTTTEMTKTLFVTTINAAITAWLSTNTGYDTHYYKYQAANYPKLSDTDTDD